jgi:CRISPR/Cas system-associated exonuclease Cas4 (RecB family)
VKIEHISPSRKDTWETCELKYKYRYHLKLESPEPEPSYLTYGKIIHKIAEKFVKAKGEKTIDEILASVKKGEILIDENHISVPSNYKQKINGHLSSINRLVEKIGFSGEVEWAFEHDLDPPNQKLFVGVIDRLMTTGKKYFILDYKTTRKDGGWQKSPKTIKNDFQLRCYSKAIQLSFGAEAENIEAALYYVDGTKSGQPLLRTKFSQESLDLAEKELLQTYKSIESKDPSTVRGTLGSHCKYCEYKSICPDNRKTKITKNNLPPTLRW